MFLRKSVRRARGSSGAAPRVSGLSPEPLESRRLFAAIIWSENFDGLAFGPKQEETFEATTDPTHVWTNVPPAGWIRDDTGVPGYNNPPDNNGVTEWIGWTFPRKDWWVGAAGDQERSKFLRASGGVMVADDDEWDDQAHPGDTDYAAHELYNAKMTTSSIAISGVEAGSTMVEFDSAWRPEARDDGLAVNNQTGIIEAVYPDGTAVEILHWDSVSDSPFYKDDRPGHWNEHVAVPLPIPAGVTSVKLRFTLGMAANDWWWAVDNLAVTGTPAVQNVKLVGVTGGEGTGANATNNEKLWEVVVTPGSVATAKILDLPAIPDDDAIGFNPATGLLHHTSGGTSTSDDPADDHYRDNHFMQTIDVLDGTNAQATVFNANAQQFGPAGPFPTFVLPAARRTNAQTDPSFGFEARGPGEYWNARDLTWSAAHNAFFAVDQFGVFKITADGQSTFVGDPGVGGEGPAAISFFNVDGRRRLLMAQFDALFTIDPATGALVGDGVLLTDATGNPIPGLISIVESPDTNTLLGIARDPAAPDDPMRRDLVQINPLTGVVTTVGRFNVPMSDLAFVYEPATTQAVVSEVYVRGSQWVTPAGAPTPFTQYLESKGMGDDVYGYRLFGTGRTPPAQNPEDILPWINMDQLVVKYSSPPTGSGVPTPGALSVVGTNAAASSYTITGVAPVTGDPAAFVLTLSKPLGGGNPATGVAPTNAENGDDITLGVPGGGAAGSAFLLKMHVLQGDTDHLAEAGNHVVLARDYSEVKKKFFKDTDDVPAGNDTDYSVFHDVDASGNILARDYSEVKKRFFQNLPPPPAAAAGDLFGSARVADEVLK